MLTENRFKSTLRNRIPGCYFWVQRMVGRIATLILWIRQIELPSYFNASHRIGLLYRGTEMDVALAVERLLKSRDTVLDIGANVGLLTQGFAKLVGRNGCVLSFEPDAKTAAFLKRNVRNLPQVQVFEMALSDRNGTAQFFLNSESGTANSLEEPNITGEVVTVSCSTLDDFLIGHPLKTISLIKIDVEGAEPRVLRGIARTLEQHPETCLIVEFCPRNLKQAEVEPSALIDQIRAFGFDMYTLSENGSFDKVEDLTTLMQRLSPHGYVNLLCARPGDQRVAACPASQPTGRTPLEK